jgi:hypothetical protein
LKPRSTVYEWFGLKIPRTVFAGLTSKPVATVSSGLASKRHGTVSDGLASKPAMTVFSGLGSKPVATVFSSFALNWWRRFLSIWPQNRRSISWLSLKPKVVEGFAGSGLKIGSFNLVIWVSKSPRWFLGLDLKTR